MHAIFKSLLFAVGALFFAAVALTAYAFKVQQNYNAIPPPMAAKAMQADAIFVDKSERLMQLLREGAVIREYLIALGQNPLGRKQREGDNRTPVGAYTIDWRNPNSVAHLSLHISYPNASDRARAQAKGVNPGGDIMIHGILNGWDFLGFLNSLWDWTNGCIAVTNREMEEIWSLVPNGTPITIQD